MRLRRLARTVIVAAAVAACATAVAAPASGNTDEPEPLQQDGSFDSIATTPGDDTLWAVRNTAGRICGDQLMSYRPGQGWAPHDVPEADDPTDICGVAMTSATDGWAVDIHNGLLRWDGSEWARQEVDAITPDDRVFNVSASGPDDVWMLGTEPSDVGSEDTPTSWHWDGKTWQRVDLPEGTVWAHNIVAVSPTDAWIVGDDYAGSDQFVQAYAIHWDGESWTMMDLPEANQGVDIAASSPSSVWASVDGDDGRTLMHWDGESWGAVPDPAEGAVGDLDAEDGGDVWSVDTETDSAGDATTNRLLSTDGETWTSSTAPDVCEQGQDLYLDDVAVAGSNDVYTAGSCTGQDSVTVAFHFDGETWTRL
jgi:hypothetical protein